MLSMAGVSLYRNCNYPSSIIAVFRDSTAPHLSNERNGVIVIYRTVLPHEHFLAVHQTGGE
jgi:hypothetical protein